MQYPHNTIKMAHASFVPIIVAILLISAQKSASYPQPKAGCSISIVGLTPQPVVVSSATKSFLYAEPGVNDISINANEKIIISTPGGLVSHSSLNAASSLEATCVSGATFLIQNKNINFNTLKYSRNPFHTARYTGNTCENNGKEAEIGFALNNNEFARQIRLCFDSSTFITRYSEFNLTRSIGEHESGVARPSFIADSFYSNLGTSLDGLYARATQRATINSQVGLSASSTKYVQDNTDYYLARGHLSAKADFVYAAQQTATFHYINSAPQFQTFNGANWNTLEMNVRDYAESKEIDLIVYSGSHGITTLPHESTGRDVELYFYVDRNNYGSIPIPEFFWKVVYQPSTKRGVAFVGLNNPYQTDVKKSVICSDVSSKINWLSWKPTDLKQGYSYSCDVNEFRKVVDYLPKFDVTSLLV